MQWMFTLIIILTIANTSYQIYKLEIMYLEVKPFTSNTLALYVCMQHMHHMTYGCFKQNSLENSSILAIFSSVVNS